MNVAIDAFLLLSPTTGIGRYTRSLVEQLARWPEFDLHLYYGLRWSRELRSAPVPGITRLKAMVKRAVPAPYAVLRALRQVGFTAGTLRRNIALYHAPAFIPLRFSGPTVITVHDLSFVRYPQAHVPAMVRALNRHLPAAIERSAFVLVDSEFVRSEVLEVYRPPAQKVVTTPLGVAGHFAPLGAADTHAVLRRYGLRHGGYVLNVGTLEPRKNLGGALQAYALLSSALRRQHPFVIVGMQGWQTGKLGADLDRLARTGEVRPLGYVPEEDLPALYSGAAVFFYPSLYEGFGLPVLEALACGAPVVTSNGSSLKELAAQHAATVDPGDIVAMKEALQAALETRGGGDAHRSRRIAWARSFTWARCAEQTAAVYRRALGRSD